VKTIDYEPQSCNQCYVLVHPDELAHHVEAVHSGRIDATEAVVAFLDAVDAEELERVTLEMIGYSDSPTQTMLDVLKAWAQGKQPTGP
jgi:hypothetical protein